MRLTFIRASLRPAQVSALNEQVTSLSSQLAAAQAKLRATSLGSPGGEDTAAAGGGDAPGTPRNHAAAGVSSPPSSALSLSALSTSPAVQRELLAAQREAAAARKARKELEGQVGWLSRFRFGFIPFLGLFQFGLCCIQQLEELEGQVGWFLCVLLGFVVTCLRLFQLGSVASSSLRGSWVAHGVGAVPFPVCRHTIAQQLL